MERFNKFISKYVVYGPAIGLILGAIVGFIYGVTVKDKLSTDIFYGATIGACAGWGYRMDYDKKHKTKKD